MDVAYLKFHGENLRYTAYMCVPTLTLYTVEPNLMDTCDITDNSECLDCISIDIQTPSTADTPLFRITDAYFGPVRACAIVNNLA